CGPGGPGDRHSAAGSGGLGDADRRLGGTAERSGDLRPRANPGAKRVRCRSAAFPGVAGSGPGRRVDSTETGGVAMLARGSPGLRGRLLRMEVLAGLRARRHDPVLDLIRADPTQIMSLAGMPPDPWQEALLRSDANQVLMLASRQSGKSVTAAALALRTAL